MDERSPEQRVQGSPLSLVLAGQPYSLRILNRREEREWRAMLQDKTGQLFGSLDKLNLADGGIFNLASDSIAELVLAYDADHVTGAGIEDYDEASNHEIYAALKAILGVAFPFVTDLGTLASLGLSPSPSSTNGRSTTGPVSVTPGPSTKRSPRSK